MARNGSGTYNRAVSPYVAGTTITAASVNSEMDDIATALTGSMARDGQSPATANIPMGGFRLTGLGNAIASTDAATLGQITTFALTKAGDTMTGALGVIAGTAAAPGVFVSGDTNTGLFQPAADTLAVTVGGVEIIRFSANGFGFVGQIAFFPTNAAPNSWLKANGALLSRSAYPALWTFANASGNIVSDATWTATNGPIGSFSTGDGSTTFRIPDLRGEFLRGWDDARGVDSGRAIGTFQDGQLLSHGHTLTDPGHFHGIAGNNGGTAGMMASRDVANDLSYQLGGFGTNQFNTAASSTGITIANTGGAENRPRNVALLACIKF